MKLTIIIPTLGRTEKLKKVINAITLCEDYNNTNPEIIIIYNGTQTQKQETYKNQNIKILQTKKQGASTARNIGLQKTKGEIIAFIGDDTIPTKTWLQELIKFHKTNPQPNIALLGKVSWTPELEKDPFHQWLENNGQFTYKKLKNTPPTYKNFYTSNISLKKSFINKEQFSEQFKGWGFEDTEFGYRLSKKGLKIKYNKNCEVIHDHKQTLENFLKNTKSARKNAKIFETIHPELKILPKGPKLLILKTAILLTTPLTPFSKKINWWREWKKAWTDQN